MPTSDDEFTRRYVALNPKQREAVDAIEGPVMVIAGPGSGKTEILSLRVANILKRTDTSPGTILCLTFTDSAAINMRRRLFDLIGEAAFRVSIHTFHGFATRVIDRYPQFFFEGADFRPADDVTQIETLRKVFQDLPHDHPLKTTHPEQGFIYLRDVKKRIEELKRAGVTPKAFGALLDGNEKEFDRLEKTLAPLFERVSKKSFDAYRGIVDSLKKGGPLQKRAGQSLSAALDAAESADSTTPISEWKKRWIKKSAAGENVWRDRVYSDKMHGLREIFELYEAALYNEGYFDFGDMIMRVIETLETTPELRMELEETYQYILIDEFQDTNGAQMRLVELLTTAPVHEGRPNIMAVGDDDQAIYKFQGAEVDNIVAFTKLYKKPAFIVLGHNYRSTKDILDIAERVVSFNAHRLAHIMPGTAKALVQANMAIEKGGIYKAILETPPEELKFVADEAKRLVAKGVSPRDIAVITREHDTLQALVPYLHDRGIPVSYEKQRNVLHEEHVRELVTIARYIHARAGAEPFSGDYLLPEILRYPCWGIEEKELWKLARLAVDKGISWTEALGSIADTKMAAIGGFLGELASRSASSTVEFILDNLIGTLSIAIDEEGGFDRPKLLSFKSPFRGYYWSDERLVDHKAEYLSFLSSLRIFIEALREYKSGAPLSLADLVEFVDIREKNRLPLLDNSPFVQAQNAVTLVTAHKAKGQEFPYVFILSCQDDVWAESSSRNKLPFPADLPITPSEDAVSDFARIFFVAVTRARHSLYFTGYARDMAGKESLPVRFINTSKDDQAGVLGIIQDVTPKARNDIETLELAQRSALVIPRVADERALFEPLLEKYQMSVTHLANFLDIEKGGPRYFFEQNMLRFPQAKTPSLSFGTAIHETLRRVQTHLKREGSLPDMPTVLVWFDALMGRERLAPADEKHYASKGHSILASYIAERGQSMAPADDAEVSFKHEGVVVRGARLDGKIDKVSYVDGGLVLTDYKTGGTVDDWETADARDALKVKKYKRQLLFYKLLVEGSARFKGIKALRGRIDFIEPDGGKLVSLECDLDPAEAERLGLLAAAVYKKILALDFPDISSYSPDKKGMERFESDLIAGTI